MRGWNVTKFLSAGSPGHAFARCVWTVPTRQQKYKLGTYAKRLETEVRPQRAFHKQGLAPKGVRFCSFKPMNRLGMRAHEKLDKDVQNQNVPFQTEDESPTGSLVHMILMEEIGGVLGTWLRREKSPEQLKEKPDELIYLMVAFKKHKLTHGDLALEQHRVRLYRFVEEIHEVEADRFRPVVRGNSVHEPLEVGADMRALDTTLRVALYTENRGDLVRYIRKFALSSELTILVRLRW